MKKENKKRIIVVLGMHRSGTSVITAGLEVLGVNLGNNLMDAKDDNNKGFFEDIDVYALNEEILSALHRNWNDLSILSTTGLNHENMGQFRLRAIELIRAKVGKEPFGLKDPRMAVLLPFWQSVFMCLNIKVNYVVAIRHPMSIMKSLHKRDGFADEKGCYLWLEHVLTSMIETVDENRVIVDFDLLMSNPIVQLERMADALQLQFNPNALPVKEYAHDFLDKKLQHTLFNDEDLSVHPAISHDVIIAYRLLLRLAKDKVKMDAEIVQKTFKQIEERLQYMSPALRYMAKIDKKIAERDSQIAGLNAAVVERDSQIAGLNAAVVERDSQIAGLNAAVVERDSQIAGLNAAVVERDSQIAGLNAAVVERDSQIAGLNGVIIEYRESTSWRLTAPLRWSFHQVKRSQHLFRVLPKFKTQAGGMRSLLSRSFRVMRSEGIQGVKQRIRNQDRTMEIYAESAERYMIDQIKSGPLISVAIPIYNPPLEYLNECIQSVRNQSYHNWELILVDDCSPNLEVHSMMRKYASQDARIKCVFHKENGHISKTINSAVKVAEGDFFTVLDHDDKLNLLALSYVAKCVEDNPDADYIYTDEDKLSEDGKNTFGPFFKPDWSPEYMLAMMYTCHLSVFRLGIIRKVGGYRSALDGTQDYDLALRVAACTERIFHIPKVLYHWRVWSNSTAQSLDAKPYVVERQKKALHDYLSSIGNTFRIDEGPLLGHHSVVFLPQRESLISIVIPTANGVIEIDGRVESHIDEVVATILGKSTYLNYEIIIVHNGDLSDRQVSYFNSRDNISLVQYEGEPFSLSEKINMGCEVASGEYFVIMNDDIRVVSEDWMERMLGALQRQGVGVVGPKLLFPNGSIQHAGVVLLRGAPGHVYYEQPEETQGYALGALVNRNYLAVTGACQMTPKVLWDEIGGYDERYPLNYNDVDYCLKLHQKGYRAVYLADVKLYHYEGVSKEGGRSVRSGELERFLDDWHSLYPHDPYYNPNLNQQIPYGG